MTAKRLRKCRAVDGEGKPKPGFPAQPTSPWKSLLRFPHSRSPGHDRHGKGEIQKQDSPFPTATCLSVSNKSKTRGDQPPARNLVLQAHLRIGICYVKDNILQFVQEENDADKKCRVVVIRNRVLGAQVNKSGNCSTVIGLNKTGVSLRYVMRRPGASVHRQ